MPNTQKFQFTQLSIFDALGVPYAPVKSTETAPPKRDAKVAQR